MSRDEPAAKRFSRAAPTIRDVAARAGVATATVSNVLTGRRQVAEDLSGATWASTTALAWVSLTLGAVEREIVPQLLAGSCQ